MQRLGLDTYENDTNSSSLLISQPPKDLLDLLLDHLHSEKEVPEEFLITHDASEQLLLDSPTPTALQNSGMTAEELQWIFDWLQEIIKKKRKRKLFQLPSVESNLMIEFQQLYNEKIALLESDILKLDDGNAQL